MARAAKKQADATVGHNSNDVNEDSRRVLFFVNRTDWLAAMAAKKAADAKVKLVGKQIKADLGEHGLQQIKDYELAQTEEGQAKLKAAIDSKMQAMRFAGMPVGTQLDIFEDRAPLVERAARAGEEAGMRGDALSNPYNEASAEGQAFAEGWHKGQRSIFAIRELRLKDEAAELIKGADSEDPGFDDGDLEAAE